MHVSRNSTSFMHRWRNHEETIRRFKVRRIKNLTKNFELGASNFLFLIYPHCKLRGSLNVLKCCLLVCPVAQKNRVVQTFWGKAKQGFAKVPPGQQFFESTILGFRTPGDLCVHQERKEVSFGSLRSISGPSKVWRPKHSRRVKSIKKGEDGKNFIASWTLDTLALN